MGLWSATSIGVGAMIGAGLFALIGIAVDITGQVAYIAFIVAGIVALLTTSYSVSKLAVQFPSKGGPVETGSNYLYGNKCGQSKAQETNWQSTMDCLAGNRKHQLFILRSFLFPEATSNIYYWQSYL